MRARPEPPAPATIHLRIGPGISPEALDLYRACFASVAYNYGSAARRAMPPPVPEPVLDERSCDEWFAADAARAERTDRAA